MRLKLPLLLLLSWLAINANAQLFGPKRSNIDVDLSNWKIMLGDTITLNWDVTINRRHLKVTLNDNVVERKGSIRIHPDTTQFFRITAETVRGNSVSRTKKVKVLYPEIERLSMSDSIRFNHQDEVRWNVKNAEFVTFNGKPVNTRGDTILTIKKDQPVNLKAVNKNGIAISESDTIKAWYKYKYWSIGLPERDTIIVKGGTGITLDWHLDNVTQPTINNRGINSRGTLSDTIKTDTTFVLEARKYDGSKYRQSITFLKQPVNLQHLSITNLFTKAGSRGEYAESIRKFNPYKLKWIVKGVNNVSIDGITLPASGALPDQAMVGKNYTVFWDYYNDYGQIKRDSASIDLELKTRRLFSGNTRTETLMEEDTISMEIVSVNYDHYPPETKLKIIALDQKGDFVTGLASKEQTNQKNLFHSIVENYENKDYQVRNFKVAEHLASEKEHQPQNIMMVMDYSGSMDYVMPGMEAIIHQQIKNKHPLDTIRFLKFDETMTAISPASTNVDTLLKYFSKTGMEELSGYTALYAATDSAMNALSANNPNQHIILFTDGYENASIIYQNHLNTSAVEIIKRANKMDLPVYVISLGSYVNEFVLKYLADYTNAHYYQVNDIESISGAIREIFKTNMHYYSISYETRKAYKKEKTISLTYSSNATGLNYSTKKAAKNPDLRKIAKKDIPPLPSKIQTFLKKQNLEPLTGPQNVVNFRFDKHKIREEYTHDIEQYVTVLNNEPDTKAIIMGHTDMKGHPDYCMKLSQKRANAVTEKLIARGISPTRLFTMGFGKKNPLWPNDATPAKAAENRRVEILFVE